MTDSINRIITLTTDQLKPRRLLALGHHSRCPIAKSEWSNLSLQTAHRTCCLTSAERELFDALNHKSATHYAQPNQSPGYANYSCDSKTAAILIRSKYDNGKKVDLIDCGTRGVVNPNKRFLCNNRFFCPTCGYIKYMKPTIDEFSDTFATAGKCFYLVFSLSRNPDERQRLTIEPALAEYWGTSRSTTSAGCSPDGIKQEDYGIEFKGPDQAVEAHALYSIITTVMREFLDGRKVASGAILAPEVAVRFMPMRILPHVNVILWCDDCQEEHVRELRRAVKQKMRDCRVVEGGLYPALFASLISHSDEFERVVKYVYKPINLATSYESAAAIVNYNPEGLADLNNQVNQFVVSVLPSIFKQIDRHIKLGNCHAASNGYIGTVTEQRQRQRVRARAAKKAKKHFEADMAKHFGPIVRKPRRRRTIQSIQDEVFDLCENAADRMTGATASRFTQWLAKQNAPDAARRVFT